MENDKKFWFLKLSYRLWVPISWEGWLITCGLALTLFLIHAQMGVAGKETFNLARHWPILVELGMTVVAFFWLAHGHVKKPN